MAGLTLQRIKRESQAFCEDIIELARTRTRFSASVSIGSATSDVFLSGSGLATDSLLSAFVASRKSGIATPSDSAIYVISREDLPALPSFEWARGWIGLHQVIPESVSYPFRLFLDGHTGHVYVYDTRSRIGVVRTRHQSETDLRGMITPFRLMWSWLATSAGAAIIHASAVHTRYGTVAFAGASGSGKSSTATYMALEGSQLISDDCLWIQDGECYPVFSRAKVDPGSAIARKLARRGIQLANYPTEGPSKAFFSISKLNERMISPTKVVHIFFPRIWPTSSHMRLTARDAYRRLETDSGREVFRNGVRSRLHIAELCRTVPSSSLWIGPDADHNTRTILSILQERQHD